MKKSLIIVLVLCMILAILATSCGTVSNTTAPSTSKATETTSGASTEKPTEAKKIKMVFIPKNTGNPYFDNIDKGFQQAAQELGFEYTTVGPATADATSQIPILKAQIQRGVDVIAIYLNSVDAMAPIFTEARQKGIKVIFLGTDSPLVDTRDAFIGAVDMDAVGPALVELQGSFINYKGDIAIVSGTTDSPDHNYWINGMKKALETDVKYKDMKIIDIVYGNDDPQKSLTETEALLSKYPNLNGIIAPTTVAVAAVAQAVETANKADTVKYTGLGTPNQMRRFIENGQCQAFGLWVPAHMGYVAAYLTYNMINDGFEVKEGAVIKVGELGERTILKDNIINADPFVIFNKDNINDYDF